MARLDPLRRHPVITVVILGGALLGGCIGFLYLDPEWWAVRRIAAGAVAGGGLGLFVTATRMMG